MPQVIALTTDIGQEGRLRVRMLKLVTDVETESTLGLLNSKFTFPETNQPIKSIIIALENRESADCVPGIVLEARCRSPIYS